MPDAPGYAGSGLPHISVCICTYKRPALLQRTLETVFEQRSGGNFTYSVVVADNDQAESSRAVVEALGAASPVPVKYCVESRQNIARCRNKAVENASGDFIAFIDDDEYPVVDWLQNLLRTLQEFGADGTLGPVQPHFDQGAPEWVKQGGFYDRPVQKTGLVLHWKQCRTGNVLLKRALFTGNVEPFNPECLSGEDQDFFRRKMALGHRFVWCHEAPAYEVVPPVRWQRGFLLRRALFRGIFAQRNHGFQPLRVLQAVVSVPVYVLLLPFALLLGQARFMTCLFKLSYHAGRLFALFGWNPIRQAYVTD